jgi:hypothetical protein
MARDLSASPWRSAAIAPLLTPLALTALTVSEALLEGRTLGPFGDLDSNAQMLLLVWSISYSYMWVLAVPTMLFTRRWITWSWVRLLFLGALLGALPWLVVFVAERADSLPSRSSVDLWNELVRFIFFADDSIVLKFGAIGSLVAGAFCLLQMYVFRAPSNNALEQTRDG